MSRNALHLSALGMGGVCLILQAATSLHHYFIVGNIWLAASLVISAVNRR